MSSTSLANYTKSQQIDINLIRLYLQITTLSDMTEPDGLHACKYHIKGHHRPDQSIDNITWPRQEQVTQSQTKLWTRFISSAYFRYGNKWRQSPLSTNSTEDEQPASVPTHYPTIRGCLQSLPIWYQRLLSNYEQEETDLIIWRSFRSRRRLIIASDRSLLPTAGTFGWKETTDKHSTLFQGTGPIDGPIDIGSSTRSELGGFTAPLLLITMIARNWGL